MAHSIFDWWRQRYPDQSHYTDAQIGVAILSKDPSAFTAHPELNQYRDSYQRIKDRENGAAFDRQTVQGFQQAMEKPEEERGLFATYLNDPRKRGILMSKQADIVTSFSGVNKEFTREDAENLVKIKQELDDLEVSEHFKEFQEADGFLNAWGEFWGLKETPAILAEVTTESLSALLHTGWKNIAGGAATGAATGAAAGAVGGPLAGVTAGAGALWGAGGGMGKTSYDLSASSKFMETIEATVGRDIMDDPQALFDSLNDPETLKKARSKAAKYGMPIALFDTLSMGLAGRGVKIGEKIASAAGSRAAAPRLAQEGLLNRAARLGYLGTEKVAPYAAPLAFQGTLGASGEFFGQLNSEGKVDDWKSVFLEGIAEFGMAPFEITAANLTKDMSPEYARVIQDRIKDRYKQNFTLDQIHAEYDNQVREGVITEEGAEIAKGLATEAYETYNNEGVDAIPPSSQGAEVKIGRERALKELNNAIKNEQRRQEGTYAVRKSQQAESVPTVLTAIGTKSKVEKYFKSTDEEKAAMVEGGEVEVGPFSQAEVEKKRSASKVNLIAQDFETPEGAAKSVEKKQDLEENRVKNVLEGAREDGVYESFDQLKDPLAASELLSGNREFADDVNSGLNDPDTAEMSTSEIIRETLGATKHEGLPDVNRERVEAIAAYYELNPAFLDLQANIDAGVNPFAEEQLDLLKASPEESGRTLGPARLTEGGTLESNQTESILETEEAKYFDAPQVDTRRRGQRELFEQAREDSPELFEAKGPAQQIEEEINKINNRNKQLAGIDRGLTGTPLGEGEAIDVRTPIQTTKKGKLDPSQSAIFSLDTSQFTVDELGAFAVPVKVSRKGRGDQVFNQIEGFRRFGTKLASNWKNTYGEKAAQWAWDGFTKAVTQAKAIIDAEKQRAADRGVAPDLTQEGLYKGFNGYTVMNNVFLDNARRALTEREVMGRQVLTSKQRVALGGAGWEFATRPEDAATTTEEREAQRVQDAQSIYTELGESYAPEAAKTAEEIIGNNPDINRQIDEGNRTPAEVARVEKAKEDLTDFIAQFNSALDFQLGIETNSSVEDISSTGLSRRLFREVFMPALTKSIELENSKKPEYKRLIRERESLSSELRRLDKKIDDISGNKLVQYITRYNSYATQIKASDLYSEAEIQSNPSLTPDTVITHHSVVEGVYEILARESILPKNSNIEVDVKLGEQTVRRKAKEYVAELESRRKIVSNALFDLGVKVRAAEEAMSGSTRTVDYDGMRAGIAKIYKSINLQRNLQQFQPLTGAPKKTKTQYYVKNKRSGNMKIVSREVYSRFSGDKETKPFYGTQGGGTYTNYYLRDKLNLLQRKVRQSFNEATLYSTIGGEQQFIETSRDAQFAETVRGTEPDLFNQGVRFFKEDKLSGSFSEAFDHIYSQLNPEEMAFADRFLPFLKLAGAKSALNTKVILVELNSSDGSAPPAFYNTVFDQIVIDPNRLRNSPFTAFKVLLEEYFHSLTSGALLLDSNKGMEKRLTKMLEKIRAEVKKRGGYDAVGMKSGYPLLNVHEMVAHAMFDPAFESLLRTIAPTEKTNKFTDFFDQVLDAIKKLLGLNKSHDSILQEVREMAFNLMHQKEVMTSRTGGRFGVYNALMSGGGDRIVTIKHYDTGKYDEHVWIANNPRSGVRIHSDDKHYSYIPPDTRTKEFFDAVKKGIKEEASLSEFAETPFAEASQVTETEAVGSFAEPIPERTEGELAKDKIRRSIEPIERKEGMVRSEMSLWDKFKEQLVTKSQILNVFQDMIMERNNIAGKTRVTLAEMHELQAGSPVKADLRVTKFREDMQALLGKDPEQLQKFNEYITNLRIQDRLKNPLAEEDLARLETLNGYIDLEGNFVVPEEELAAGRTTEDIKHEFITLVDKTKRVGDFKDRSDVPTLVKGVEALMEEINDPEILRYQRNADGNIMYNVDGPLFEGKFVEAAELYHSHFQSALFDMYNSGLITSRAYTDMVNSSSFYAPFFVLKYFNRNPEDTFGSYIKGIQDEDWGILRPMDAAEYKLYNTQLRIDRNQMLLKMKDFKDDFDPDGNFITISNEQYASADLDSVKFYDRGNVRYMVMDDEVARLLNSFDPVSTSTTYMTTKLAGDIFKLGATGMNLFFQAGNFLMFDPIRLLTTSRAGLRAKDKGLSPIVLGMQYLKAMMASSWANLTPNSVKNLVREYAPNQIDQLETLYSEFVNSGAAGSTIAEYFDKATQIKDPLTRGNNARRNPVSNAILWGNAKASSVGKTLEQTAKMVGMQRMKIFEGLDVLEQKIQDEKDPQKLAALQKEAQEVSDQIAVEIRNFAGSPDFIRKGKFTDSEALNVIFMFFNARIQGVERDLSRMLQIFSPKGDKAEAMKVMLKVSAFAAMPTMLAWSMNRRYKDDYDEVSDEEKKRYFMIPLDEMFEHPYIEGKMVRDYIRVPRRESFGLFSYTLEKGLDFFYEKDPDAVNELLGFWLESTMPVNIAGLTEGDLLKAGESVGSSLNPLLKAPAELIGNRNFFRHKPLVPQSLADADAKEQYYESTPDVYKALGGMTGLGALRTKHLLESLTAGGITQFFPNKDVGIPSEAGVPALGRTIASTPLVSRLARSSYLAESDLQEIMDDSDQLSATDRVIRRRFVDRWFSDTRGMTIQDRVRHIPPATNHSEKLRNDMIIKRLRMMALGLEPDEARLAGMPVDARADVIFNQMQNRTPAEVKVYLTDLASKRIVTQGVANVLMERMASRGEDIYDYTAEPVR